MARCVYMSFSLFLIFLSSFSLRLSLPPSPFLYVLVPCMYVAVLAYEEIPRLYRSVRALWSVVGRGNDGAVCILCLSLCVSVLPSPCLCLCLCLALFLYVLIPCMYVAVRAYEEIPRLYRSVRALWSVVERGNDGAVCVLCLFMCVSIISYSLPLPPIVCQ